MVIIVGIIEDDLQICRNLQDLIDNSEGFSCKHVYHTAEDALKDLPELRLDVVLTDIHLPKKSGIDCVAALKMLVPDTQFVMCTSFEDSESVFKALKAGATGYLTKTTQPSKILDAIVEVYNGGSPMSSHIARKVVLSFQELEQKKELQQLSNREKEILDLLSKGLRYKEIADRLYLSTETIRTHIRNIYQKLQVNSKVDALNKIYRQW